MTAHSPHWPGPGACDHSSTLIEGRLMCRRCGAEYRIELPRARWTGPRPLVVARYFPHSLPIAAE